MKPPALFLLALVPLLVAQENPPAATPSVALPPAEPVEQILLPPEPGRFKSLFQPFRTEHAALSPDGRHLAYSVREGETVSVVVIDLNHPDTMKARVQVIDANAATPMLAQNQHEKTPGRILWMRWMTPTRVVVETNHAYARTTGIDALWSTWTGAVLGFDADGGNARKLASPEDLLEYTQDPGSENPFAVTRGDSAGFRSRVTTPDQPTPIPGRETELLAPQEPASLLDTASATNPPTATGAMQPRSLHIFDLDPQRPGAVTLVSTGFRRDTGSHWLGLYSLDTQTGKLTNLTDELVPNTRSSLLDRQGRVRLAVPSTLLSSFPFRYEYLGDEGRNRPRPLDDAVGLHGFSVSPDNYFGERAIPLGFDEDPNILYYASNLGRDTYGLYSLNLATKQRGALTMENPAYDLIGPPSAGFPDSSTLVFDRFQHRLIGVRYQGALRTTAWIRPEWQAVQSELEKALPGRSVDLLDWDEAARRFVVRTEGPADPGAFFVYDREQRQLRELVRRAPWIDAHHTHATLPFSFATPDGARISGLVTLPRQPRMKPVPMVVLCPDQPWLRVPPGFQTEVHALAEMGFVVVQLNGRGAWGLGLKQRQSLTTGYDLVQVEDIATTAAALEKLFHVNPKRVALMGRGHGGFIALRALQTHPDRFRCAITLEAPVDLADWLAQLKWSDDDVLPHLTRAWLGDEARLKASPLTSHPESLTKPVLFLGYPGLDGAPRRAGYIAARRLAEAVRKNGNTAGFDDLSTDYMNGLPAARAEVFDRIEAFLNEHLYDYKVKLRDLKILPEKKT